jgi:glycosyltransferase involved in cell wall biosynthesis
VRAIFNTITGLGYVFSGKSNWFLKTLVTLMYRFALKNTTILFQNPDDKNLFNENGIADPKKCFLILGSGIDMERFKALPEVDGVPVVILSSRFVEEKGIRYFVEASRILQSRHEHIRFVLVGRSEADQPTSIQHSEIEYWVKTGLVEWWGWHNDMEEIYPLAHIICLPTYYMEGIPKSLIEAAACGRAIIATNVPGCREIVHNGENGILVPPKDAEALADAIAKLANDRVLRETMGRKSREIAINSYSMEIIIARYFELYHFAD